METFSALLAVCAGNSPVPVNFRHKGRWRGALMFSLICAWGHNLPRQWLCEGNSPVTDYFPASRASNVEKFAFDDVIMNKLSPESMLIQDDEPVWRHNATNWTTDEYGMGDRVSASFLFVVSCGEVAHFAVVLLRVTKWIAIGTQPFIILCKYHIQESSTLGWLLNN